MKADLLRHVYGQRQTLGGIYINDVKICVTLELPWRQNKRSISCIPEGTYTLVKRQGHEKRPYIHFHVKGVPGRSLILIHRGNFVTQIKGCILPGRSYADLNKDGLYDVIDSTSALIDLLERLPDECKLNVKSYDKTIKTLENHT